MDKEYKTAIEQSKREVELYKNQAEKFQKILVDIHEKSTKVSPLKKRRAGMSECKEVGG